MMITVHAVHIHAHVDAHVAHLLLHRRHGGARPLGLPVVLVVVMMARGVRHQAVVVAAVAAAHHHGRHDGRRGRGHAAVADKVAADGISVGGVDRAHLSGMDGSLLLLDVDLRLHVVMVGCHSWAIC